ncbi:START-like domain-containing protein [Wenyingzhuangia sp. 2_MG-2023]|uniref:START-like domain-containing protein n=1 Tax=Wenyingzhuangia sp. 2_MG-2023 TaxID=3062639 RepID=UPI0038B6A656
MTKEKFQIEFPIHASPAMLYQYFATPSGLGEWFADNVNSRGEMFTFMWDGSEEQAKLLSYKADDRAKFHWVDDEDENAFFEFKIQVDALTKDVSLIITDFAEEDELDEAKMLWENQIAELKHLIGA